MKQLNIKQEAPVQTTHSRGLFFATFFKGVEGIKEFITVLDRLIEAGKVEVKA